MGPGWLKGEGGILVAGIKKKDYSVCHRKEASASARKKKRIKGREEISFPPPREGVALGG